MGPDRRRRRHLDWDIRGIIAVLALSFAFIVAVLQITVAWHAGRFATIEALSKAAEVPTWVAGLVGSIIGFYFGGRAGGNGNGNGNGH